MNKSKVMVLELLLVLTGFTSCKKDEPVQPHEASVQLTLEDVSCTEAWLKVSLTDEAEPRTIAVQQDGQRVLAANVGRPDSLFVVEGLLPRHTYSFVAQRLRDSTVIDASSTVQATTMDTTSHDIVWQPIETLGDGNSSTLLDIAIINDSLAYAVGEMYLRDSTGQFDVLPYNMAVWNGSHWEMRRLMYGGYPAPIRFIFALGENDIWFGIGYLIHWDGVRYREVEVPVLYGVGSNKMWGSTSGLLYVVGNDGTIAYSSNHGSTWGRVASGTTVPLNDAWGGSNRIVGQNIVLMTGSDSFTLSERKILRVKQGGIVDSLIWGTVYLRPQSIWFNEHEVFVCGDKLFRLCHDMTWRELRTPSIYLDCVRGTAQNDLFIVGDFGIVLHYNGISIGEYPDVRLSQGIYQSVAVTSKIVIAVGWLGPRAVALVGKR